MRVVCYCDYGAYGYCCAIGVIHTGAKSGCELVMRLPCLWYDKLWGPSQRVVTLFFSICHNARYYSITPVTHLLYIILISAHLSFGF